MSAHPRDASLPNRLRGGWWLSAGTILVLNVSLAVEPVLAQFGNAAEASGDGVSRVKIADRLPEITLHDEIDTSLLKSAEDLGKLSDAEHVRRRNRELLESAGDLPAGADRTDMLTRLTRMFLQNDDLPDARAAALAVDEQDLAKRVDMLVLIAEAERVTGNTRQAWWTLHEAQQEALKLRDPHSVITAFREIDGVENQLMPEDAETGPTGSRLDPDPDAVIRKVAREGLPAPGYQEIEVLRTGGGPLREPMVITHTYYFSGKRTFQGPLLHGGPTIAHVTHPKTGCAVTVSLTLPAGAPIVEYRSNSIKYFYPDVAVEIEFLHSGRCDIEYRHLTNKYDALRRKIMDDHGPDKDEKHADDSGAGAALRDALSVGAGGPLSLGARLPFLSNLLEPKHKRIPGTLTSP